MKIVSGVLRHLQYIKIYCAIWVCEIDTIIDFGYCYADTNIDTQIDLITINVRDFIHTLVEEPIFLFDADIGIDARDVLR